LAGYIPRWYTRPKMVTHPSTNRARRALTSFKRRTPLTITPRRQRGGDAACSCRYSSRLLVCVWPRMSRALLLSRPWSWTTSSVARRHSTAKCRAASQASSATTSRRATASSTSLTQLTHAHTHTHTHTHPFNGPLSGNNVTSSSAYARSMQA